MIITIIIIIISVVVTFFFLGMLLLYFFIGKKKICLSSKIYFINFLSLILDLSFLLFLINFMCQHFYIWLIHLKNKK